MKRDVNLPYDDLAILLALDSLQRENLGTQNNLNNFVAPFKIFKRRVFTAYPSYWRDPEPYGDFEEAFVRDLIDLERHKLVMIVPALSYLEMMQKEGKSVHKQGDVFAISTSNSVEWLKIDHKYVILTQEGKKLVDDLPESKITSVFEIGNSNLDLLTIEN